MGLIVHDYDYVRIKNDIYGNPRYAIHFFAFLNERENAEFSGNISKKYEIALRKSRKIGGHKYHNKKFGGGISFQSYNIDDTMKKISEIRNIYYKDLKR